MSEVSNASDDTPRAETQRLPVSVVLPVLNEEANIAAAVKSVAWAAEIIVVDSASTDRTRETALASAEQTRVVEFAYDGTGRRKKAWALATLDFAHDWVLFLDADERVTPPLADEIAAAIEHPGIAGYYIDREFRFMGRSLRCFRPNWNLRLFRHARGRIEDLGLAGLGHTGDNEIHEHFEVEGELAFLENPLLHDDYRGVGPWIDRHNRYATWEAHLYFKLRHEPIGVGLRGFLDLDPFQRKRVLRRIWTRLPGRPALRFVVWYGLRRGFLDGREGFIFCVLMVWYELLISLKLRELSKAADPGG